MILVCSREGSFCAEGCAMIKRYSPGIAVLAGLGGVLVLILSAFRGGNEGFGSQFQNTHVPSKSSATGGVISVAAAYDATLALTTNGDVWVWGDTHLSDIGASLTPILVEELSGIRAVSASTSGQHLCVLTQPGGVKCWGLNSDGQLGIGNTDYQRSIVEVRGLPGKAIAISAGFEHVCAVLENGSVWCWGNNENGQLGDGTTISRMMPVKVQSIENATEVAAGHNFTCALTQGGAVKCWGNEIHLGIETNADSTIPVNVEGFSSGVRSISAGSGHACAITANGGLKCWGNWFSGALGVGETYTSARTPMDVVGLTSGVEFVSAGGRHTCAIITGGNVKCWGDNQYGTLGIGTDETSLLPVDVPGIESASFLATGEAHTCAIANGEVLCWGANTAGQIGDGTQDSRPEPVVVMGSDFGFRPAGLLVPELTTYIPTPLDISPAPGVIGTNLLLAALLMLPFAIAAELFTRTLGEHEGALRKFRAFEWISKLQKKWEEKAETRIAKRPFARDTAKLVGIILFYGLVFSLLDRTWNPFSLAGLILFISMTIAYGIVGIADDIIQWRVIRKWGLTADLTLRPTNLLLAMGSTATSRLLTLIPGLMFGTPEALRTDESQFDEPKQNRLLKISALTFAVIGLGVWLPTIATAALQKTSLPESARNLIGGLEGFLLVIFAVTLENLFVQMLGFPGGFGQALKRKNKWLWLAALTGVTFLFYHTLINPRGELAEALQQANIWLFFGIALAFVIFAFGLYYSLHRKERGMPTEAAPPARIARTERPVAAKSDAVAAPASPSIEIGAKPVVVPITETKQCPVCCNQIKAEAKLCRYCKSTFSITRRGYCPTEHQPVDANEDGKCICCGNDVVDLHVESQLLKAGVVEVARVVEEIIPETPKEVESKPAADEKTCPACGKTIKAEARLCRFCRARFEVRMRGYCLTDHAVVDVMDGKCVRCGNEAKDVHLESKLLAGEINP